ncbi:Bax inhibitor-1/YccA family protein [Brumimicrobium aurantiacum]|uniref:BAX inhibitor (BI)-1/YccA family protein n=1 Tax=Brumimicrobium aurantiacum TaxID=1737063 RepID=A0A3E1EVP8_9FLAO|nr:Bax inhibitor-1/YccA family protein [Brumimicrobium aurantiacum]RFC53634.1 BAX inhibitor (BI)-1/YccA family protein [Brumimicrobium aurantiacum]
MENFIHTSTSQTATKQQVKQFFTGVYTYMAMALVVSGIVSWYLASSGLFMKWFVNLETGAVSPLFYVVAFSPLALVFLIQAKYRSFSLPALVGLFVLYSSLIGASLSSIFFVYSMGDIATTFFVTAGAFSAMAILGFTTSVDLSKMGSLLYMAFIGIFIAAIVNMFLNSDWLGYLISIVGVFVFTGLTAWEMQRLKAVAEDTTIPEDEKQKASLMGGLTLYILFINLFMSLLHLLGGRD